MPTVFRYRRYRFFFFSNEGTEPIHIHVEAGNAHAKFWLDPIRLAYSAGFRSNELGEIKDQIEAHLSEIKERWDEHFKR